MPPTQQSHGAPFSKAMKCQAAAEILPLERYSRCVSVLYMHKLYIILYIYIYLYRSRSAISRCLLILCLPLRYIDRVHVDPIYTETDFVSSFVSTWFLFSFHSADSRRPAPVVLHWFLYLSEGLLVLYVFYNGGCSLFIDIVEYIDTHSAEKIDNRERESGCIACDCGFIIDHNVIIHRETKTFNKRKRISHQQHQRTTL